MTVATKPTQTATISDVARLAGVSIKTVSRVVNDQPNVRAETRARVQEIVDELAYTPNPYARYLGSLRTKAPVKGAGELLETSD